MHLTDVLDFKAVHFNVCPCGHAPDLLACMQAPNTQLSTGMVEFAMLATSHLEAQAVLSLSPDTQSKTAFATHGQSSVSPLT